MTTELVATDLEPETVQYRPVVPTIEAFSFHGTFPLGFLRHSETVRRAAAGSSSIVVAQDRHEVHVNLGDYLVRDLSSGVLRKESGMGWFRRWEAVS